MQVEVAMMRVELATVQLETATMRLRTASDQIRTASLRLRTASLNLPESAVKLPAYRGLRLHVGATLCGRPSVVDGAVVGRAGTARPYRLSEFDLMIAGRVLWP
jgi:hypothetical protein